jgi:very-short-patch-repair endonuclease
MMKRKILPYDRHLKQVARNLRNNSTLAEILLWRELKGRKLRGFDFHRQHPIHKYIVDFFCNELSLAIEIDGSSHDGQLEYDNKRQHELEILGVRFLRFTDREVKQNLTGVVETIIEWIDAHEHTPSPSQEGNCNGVE